MIQAEAEADALAAALRAAGSPDRAVRERAYLKSDLEFSGVSVPLTWAAVRAWCRARPALAHDELVPLAAALWKRPVFERRMAAQILLIQNSAYLARPTSPSSSGCSVKRVPGPWSTVSRPT